MMRRPGSGGYLLLTAMCLPLILPEPARTASPAKGEPPAPAVLCGDGFWPACPRQPRVLGLSLGADVPDDLPQIFRSRLREGDEPVMHDPQQRQVS
jgi:hypothetical protein